MKRSLVFACAFVLAAVVPGISRADFYKWVDEKGVTHYSEKPPETGPAKRIEIAPSPEPTPRPPVNWKEKEAESQRQRLRKENSEAKAAQTQEKRHERCLTARRQLDVLGAGRSLYHVNERGERVYLEDAQRDSEAERWKDEVSANCD